MLQCTSVGKEGNPFFVIGKAEDYAFIKLYNYKKIIFVHWSTEALHSKRKTVMLIPLDPSETGLKSMCSLYIEFQLSNPHVPNEPPPEVEFDYSVCSFMSTVYILPRCCNMHHITFINNLSSQELVRICRVAYLNGKLAFLIEPPIMIFVLNSLICLNESLLQYKYCC